MAAIFLRVLAAGGLGLALTQPVFADQPTFAELLARAENQAASGHRWAPPGDNMTETVASMMVLISTATPSQLAELSALLESDASHLPPAPQSPTAEASEAPSSAAGAQPPTAAPAVPPGMTAAEPAHAEPASPGPVPPQDTAAAPPQAGPATAPPAGPAPASQPNTVTQPNSLTAGQPTGEPPTIAPAAPPNPAPAPQPTATTAAPPPPAVSTTTMAATPGKPDRSAVRSATPVSPVPLQASVRATELLARGEEAERLGDVSGARRYYTIAVQQGSPVAARNLGRLYDPAYLKQTAVGGIDPDPALARHWYERAVAMGDPVAGPLLEALALR